MLVREFGKSHLSWCCCCLLTVAQENNLGERDNGGCWLRARYAVDPSNDEKPGRRDQEHRVMVLVP